MQKQIVFLALTHTLKDLSHMKHRRNVPIFQKQILSGALAINQTSIDKVDQLFRFKIEQVLFDDQYDKTHLMACSARLEKRKLL